MKKDVSITPKPGRNIEDWINTSQGGGSKEAKEVWESISGKSEPATNENTKRLTFDVSPALHYRLKLEAVKRGVQMADIVRELLDSNLPSGE